MISLIDKGVPIRVPYINIKIFTKNRLKNLKNK